MELYLQEFQWRSDLERSFPSAWVIWRLLAVSRFEKPTLLWDIFDFSHTWNSASFLDSILAENIHVDVESKELDLRFMYWNFGEFHSSDPIWQHFSEKTSFFGYFLHFSTGFPPRMKFHSTGHTQFVFENLKTSFFNLPKNQSVVEVALVSQGTFAKHGISIKLFVKNWRL